MYIKRHNNSNGPNKYNIIIINSGEGVDKYHDYNENQNKYAIILESGCTTINSYY